MNNLIMLYSIEYILLYQSLCQIVVSWAVCPYVRKTK